MIVLPNSLGILRDRLVFFPSADQLRELTRSLGWRDVIRVRQTQAAAPIPPSFQRSFRTNCIDLTQEPEAILRGMQTRARRYVRAAEKISGVGLEFNTARAREDFLSIHNSFAAWKGHSAAISQSWLESIRPFSDFFVISHQGEPMVAHLLMRDSEVGRVRGLSFASRRFESPERSNLCRTLNRYLHWREMLHYGEHGFGWYDFGGIEDDTGAVSSNGQFKLSFGGVIFEDRTYYFAGGAGKLALWGLRALPSVRPLLRGRLPN